MKIHLGCGSNVLDGYLNVDAFITGPGITTARLEDLRLANGSVDEILAEHVVEHIPFEGEADFFREAFRLLTHGGRLVIEVPDLEWLCQQFIQSEDSFVDFYRVGAESHYFGNGLDQNQRWGIITTHFFGNQNGSGQFHYNGYTQQKLRRIAQIVGFSGFSVKTDFNKGAQVLVAEFTK